MVAITLATHNYVTAVSKFTDSTHRPRNGVDNTDHSELSHSDM